MRVLLTGAFGNIGESALLAMVEHGHRVTCLDIKTPHTEKVYHELAVQFDFDVCWGDVRDLGVVRSAVEGVDVVAHLAAIIPPRSDIDPELTRAVNVGGTENLLEAAIEMGTQPKFIYASSVATYGHQPPRGPPKTADDPQVATDVYTETKIASEKLVCESGLPWTVLRFGVVPAIRVDWINNEVDKTMFMIPLDQRVEFVHTRDVGLAVARAVTAPTEGKVLLIGGGERCRMTYREFIRATFEVMGIGELPEEAFLVPKSDEEYYHTNWMDTRKAQELLQFQTRTFDDYLEDLEKSLGLRRHIMRLLRPLARRRVLAASPFPFL